MTASSSKTATASTTAAIGFAIFAAVLLVAFLSYRGTDAGQLNKLIGNLGGGPFVGYEGLRDSLIGTLISLAIFISWFGLGSLVVKGISRFDRTGERFALLEVVLNTAIGAAVWSLIWFFVGLAHAYYWWAAVGGVVVGLASAVFAYVERSPVGYDEGDRRGPLGLVLIVLTGAPLFLSFIASLAPPTAKDTLLYHFAVPKAFIAQHSSAFIDGNIASYLALGTEMQTVWAMLLGGTVSTRAAEIAAEATVFLFFPLLLLAVFGWARELGISRTWSLTGIAVIGTVPSVYHVAANGYIDVALAVFVTLAVYELGRWWRYQETGSVVYIGIFLGAALSIKLTAVVVVAGFAVVILLRARDTANGEAKVGRIVATGLGSLILAALIASPWYMRNWVATGSPVFPFYMSIWPGKAAGWDIERSNLFQAMNSQYGGENKAATDYLIAPWNVSVKAQPEVAEYFDGVIGVAFLLGLPILIWGLWKFEVPVDAKIAVGIAAVMYLFWLFSSQQIRYLIPVLPAMAVAIVAAGNAVSENARTSRKVLQLSFTGASVAALLVSFAWFCQRAPLRVALGGESREDYLTRNLDYYPYYQTVNRDSPADSRVWLINMRRDTYNIDRPVFSDYLFEDWTLRKMIWESRDAQDLKARTQAMGIKYILARHDFLFDYDRSSLVDDKKPRAENEKRLAMAKALISDPANTIKADSKFSLVKVF
jgi:hypothetical protein